MIALVTGSRKWKDRHKVWKEIYKRRKKLTYVFHGGAKGADLLADDCAALLGIQTVRCDALWGRHGLAAGPIRNTMMLRLFLAVGGKEKIVLAFHSNLAKSKGTKDMVRRAKKAGLTVKVIK